MLHACSIKFRKNIKWKKNDTLFYCSEKSDLLLWYISLFLSGFLGGSVVNNLSTSAGDTGDTSLIPASGNLLEEKMATHSSIPAWKIPWTEEPGGLQSTRSQRVGHDWVTEHANFSPVFFFFFALMCYFCLFNILTLLFLLIYEKIYTIIISLKRSFLMTAFSSTQWMHHGMLRPPLLNIYVFSLRPLTMKSFTHKAFSVLRVVVEILGGKNILRTFIHMARFFSNGILHFEFPVAISKHPLCSKPYSLEILSQVLNRGHPKPRRRYHMKPVLHCGGSLPTQPLFLVATFWGPFPQTFGEKKRWSVRVGKAWGF